MPYRARWVAWQTVAAAVLFLLTFGAEGQSIYFNDATAGAIIKANLDGSSPSSIYAINGTGNFLAVDTVNSALYVSRVFNDANRGLYKGDLNLSSPVRISTSNNQIGGVAVDTVNSRIYFHDATAGSIIRANLDGSSPAALYSLSGTGSSIAVDVANNAVYFTRPLNDANRGLYKGDLNLSSPVRISTSNNQIAGVAVDTVNNKIYFHDATAGAIILANLDGSSPSSIYSLNGTSSSLAFDPVNRVVYVTRAFNDANRGLYRGDSSLSSPVRISTSNNSIGGVVTTAVLEPATVIGVSATTANGTYKAGDLITIIVTFSTAVTVTGTPRLQLNSGASVFASYSSGSDSTTLAFNYTVSVGESSSDLDYGSTSALILNGGTIKNGGLNATLTLASPGAFGSLGNNKNLVIDGVVPSVSTVNAPVNGTYITGQNLDFTVNFTEAVIVSTGGGTPYIPVTLNTGGTVQAAYISGSGTTALVFRYTIASGNLDNDGVAHGGSITINGGTLRDAAANDAILTLNSVGSTTGVLVDAVAPSVSSVSAPANASYRAGQNMDFTINFDEIVTVNTGGGTPQIGLTIGSSPANASYLSGSGSSALVFRYTVQPGDTDTDGISSVSPLSLNGGTIRDAVGNNASLTFAPPNTSSVLVDTTAPTIVIGAPSVSTTTSSPVDYTITYTGADSVTLSTGDITLNKTGSADGTVGVSGSGTSTRTVTISSITGSGTLGISIASGTASDTAGNTALSAGPSTTFVVNAAPAVAADNATIELGEGGIAANTGTFSDADGNATVTLSASVGTVTPNNGAGTWSWSFNTADGPDDSQTVTITADDGIATPATTTFTLAVTNLAPVADGQSITTPEDTATNIVLTASDAGADTITNWVVTVGPTNGTLTGTAPDLTYTPDTNFNGGDSFKFIATDSDGADSAEATVSITITPVNDAPVAGADGITRLNNTKTAKVTKTVLLSNDTDEESDPLSITAAGNATPPGATVVMAGAFVIYTAPATNAGDGSFTYTLSDGPGGHTVTNTVTVTEIASAPAAGVPNSASITPSGNDYILNFIGVPGNMYRIQYTTSSSTPYAWTEFSPPVILTAPANGVFSYTDVNPPDPMRLYRAVPHP